MSESSSFADAVAAEASRHRAVRQRAETAEAEKRAFIIAEVAKLAAEVFEVLRTRVDLAIPVMDQLEKMHLPGYARPWTQVGHVWDLDLVGMRSTGEFTSRLSIAEHRPDSWVGAPLPASALDQRTGMLRYVHAGNEPAVTPDGSTFFSLFGVAENGELGVMDYWGAERHVRARMSLASSIGRLQATGSAR